MKSLLLAKITLIADVIVLLLLGEGTDIAGPAKQIFERMVFVVQLT